MSPLQHTLKHILGALVILGLFGRFIAPSIAPLFFDVQSIRSLLYQWQSQSTGGPVQVRGIACFSLLADPLQRDGGELHASVSVPDPPDLPFGLLQLADGIDPVVE